jgi:fructokinase
MNTPQLYGGIEAGGTKFICVVASGPGHIVEEIRFSTTTPEESLGKTIQFFRPFVSSGKINAIGVGSFGPLDMNPESSTYGFIAPTPKPHWSNTDVRGTLQRGLDVPIVIDTDVNVAGLGESVWGASRGFDPSLYLTIGTGIGGGYIKELDPFNGSCPFHGDCFEGLASGPAIEKRLGIAGVNVPENDAFWDIEAEYIASALMNYILVLSPKKIILGGGVMQRQFLFVKIRYRVGELLNGYVSSKSVLENIEDYIVPPGLGNQSGSLGAIALAMQLDATNNDPRS